MSLALLFIYLVLNMFRMLIRPSSGACDLCAELFHGLYTYCSRYVLVLRCGKSVVMWYPYAGLHTDTDRVAFTCSICKQNSHFVRCIQSSSFQGYEGMHKSWEDIIS